MSSYLVCNEEGRVRAAVFIGVHLYRVAPSLYNPILGLVWWFFFPSTLLQPTSATQWIGGQSYCLCLSQSSLLCSKLEDHSSWSATGPNDNPKPLHPSPCSYNCLSYSLQNPTCSTCCMLTYMSLQHYQVKVKWVTVFLIAACAKSAPGSWQIAALIILTWS